MNISSQNSIFTKILSHPFGMHICPLKLRTIYQIWTKIMYVFTQEMLKQKEKLYIPVGQDLSLTKQTFYNFSVK